MEMRIASTTQIGLVCLLILFSLLSQECAVANLQQEFLLEELAGMSEREKRAFLSRYQRDRGVQQPSFENQPLTDIEETDLLELERVEEEREDECRERNTK